MQVEICILGSKNLKTSPFPQTLIAMMSLATLRGTSAIAACDMVADAYEYGLDYTLGVC